MDDDGADRLNAKISLEAATAGSWVAITTTRRPSVEGLFTLRVRGAKSVLPLSMDSAALEIVRAVFATRGVTSSVAMRERRIELLRQQLTLPAFRGQLLTRVQNALTQSETAERSERRELEALEKLQAQLSAALTHTSSLGVSKELVEDLLKDRSRETDSAVFLWRGRLNRRVIAKVALRAAAGELDTLDRQTAELDAIRAKIISADAQEPDVSAARARLAALQAEVDGLLPGLARRLVESGVVSVPEAEGTRPLALSLDLSKYIDGIDSPSARPTIGAGWLGRILGGITASSGASGTSGGAAGSGATGTGASGGTYSGTTGSATGSGTSAPARGSSPGQLNPAPWLPSLFPWPPPTASSRAVLTDADIAGLGARFPTLGAIDDVLTQALRQAGYASPSYWGVQDGFALVAPLEQTDAKGVPLNGQARWSLSIAEMKEFSLSEYFRALLTSPPGYFRRIVFVVTPEAFTAEHSRAVFSTVEEWASGGHAFLPVQLRSRPFTPQDRVTVLVYEFRKTKNTDLPLTTVPGRLTASAHLRSSTLFSHLK